MMRGGGQGGGRHRRSEKKRRGKEAGSLRKADLGKITEGGSDGARRIRGGRANVGKSMVESKEKKRAINSTRKGKKSKRDKKKKRRRRKGEMVRG